MFAKAIILFALIAAATCFALRDDEFNYPSVQEYLSENVSKVHNTENCNILV